MLPTRALRTLLLLALAAVLALGGSLARVASPLPEHPALTLAAAHPADHGHGHGHDADDEAAPGHAHHLGDHSHVVLGLPVLPAGLAPPAGTGLRLPRQRVTLPARASRLDRPPRTTA